MGSVITISPQIQSTLLAAFTDIVNIFGKPIKLFYPPNMIPCANCIYDSIGNKSSNRWKNGGPIPFSFGLCPMCNGNGRLADTKTEIVTAIILWNPADYIIVDPNMRLPDGTLQTKHILTDAPKLLRCTDMQIQGTIGTINHYNFQPNGEPYDPGNIVQSSFCLQNWKRSG